MPIWIWFGFIGFVLALLSLDLGVFHRRPHAIRIREACMWTAEWIGLALLFNLAVYFCYENHWFGAGLQAGQAISGKTAVSEFLAAFLLEKSLSLDNIFVIALVFTYLRVPLEYQHRVLFWGILGVLVLRGLMIGAGVVLFDLFSWVNYVFGVLLVVSAIKMLRTSEEQLAPDRNPLVRLVRHFYPVTRDFEGVRFFAAHEGRAAITPLFVSLLVVESSDVIFALDSIPAVFGVTRDPFLVFTSNILAVLGLRSLYFVLAGILHKFRHLKVSLFLVLLYVGLKMLIVHWYQTDVVVSLIVIVGILAVGVLASLSEPPTEKKVSGGRPATPGTGSAASGGAAGLAAGDDGLAIRAVQVTKFYGKRRGITDFSAAIPRGALVGLLGPNGAGKTTAIRILSCHMPPTSGTVSVCGYDVFTESLEVRRRLGYLPENCPLYTEMRVLEYLRWTAQMKGLSGSDVDRAVFATLGPCGLDHVRSLTINRLSKGYRQRVGLAAALVHRPDVLILDEPTIGLDPLQAREFRNLIGSLKGRHTVLISSHILSEIDVLCDSVIIINEGAVVASGSPQELRAHVAARYTVECRVDPSLKVLIPPLVHGLANINLESYEEHGGFATFRLAGNSEDPRLEISRSLTKMGIEIRSLTREQVTLEDVFLHYTRAGQPSAPRREAELEGVL